MTRNAELADYYNRTQDTSDFDDGQEVPIKVRRDVTVTVRVLGTTAGSGSPQGRSRE